MNDSLLNSIDGASGLNVSVRNLRARNGGAEMAVTVVIGNGENCEVKTLPITTEQYCELNLRKGALRPEQYEALERASRLCMALRCGENLLSYGSNSVRALAGKIARRGFSREEAVQAAEQLEKRGLIIEREDVKREVEKCLKKQWGAGRIRAHLRSKGFGEDALSLLPELLSDVDFSEHCALLIQKHFGGLPSDQAELRRICASLSRYGYSLSEIKNALQILQKETD